MERRERDRMRHLPFLPSILESTQENKAGQVGEKCRQVFQPLHRVLGWGNHKTTVIRTAMYSLQALCKWILLILTQRAEKHIFIVPPFTAIEMEAQRGRGTCLRIYSW